MRLILLSSLAVLGFVACTPTPTAYVNAGETRMPSLDVTATGKVSTAPDRATVSAGVVTEGKTAREAMMANATKMNSVFEGLKAAGIAEKNIQTSQLSLQPRYNYKDRQTPKIDGYEARNNVTAKSEDLQSVGAMLDALVKAGVNNIGGVQFSVENPDAALNEARSKAIKNAREKAQNMAEAAGVTLGRLMNMSEINTGNQPRPVMMQASYRSEAMDSSPTPIAGGEQSLQVTVNLSYTIEP
jgi:uncharacterized protein YggE